MRSQLPKRKINFSALKNCDAELAFATVHNGSSQQILKAFDTFCKDRCRQNFNFELESASRSGSARMIQVPPVRPGFWTLEYRKESLLVPRPGSWLLQVASMLPRGPGRPRAVGMERSHSDSESLRARSRAGPAPSQATGESESRSALVCQGCGRAFDSLRRFNGHHSSPYVRPQCRGRQNGVDEDMVVTSRDVRVRSRLRGERLEDPGTRHVQA